MKHTSFSPSEKKVLRLLVFFVILTRLALALRPDWQICTRPFGDDSFYMFSVSEHLAAGQGLSVDGIHATNGIQPLITFLYVPFFLAASTKLMAVRLCFILVALFDSLSVIFIASIIKRLSRSDTSEEQSPWLHSPIIAAALWCFLYPMLIHTANGLETGLYSALLLGSLLYYLRLRSAQNISVLHWITFGILLGLTVLSRIDAAILVAIIGGYEIIRYRGKGMMNAAIIGVTSFLVSLPWWWYNYSVFGSVMPQSGQSEAMLASISKNMTQGAVALGDLLTIFFFIPNHEWQYWVGYAWLGLMMVIWIVLIKRFQIVAYLHRHFQLREIVPFAIFGLVLVIYYVFFFGAPHFLARYFHPLRIVWLILFSCALPVIIPFVRSIKKKLPQFYTIGLVVVIIIFAGFGASRYVYYFVLQKPSDLYLSGHWAAEHPNDKIGMEQTGIAGFLSPNVINLDGKVNLAALKAREEGDIGKYIVDNNIDYLADWIDLVSPMVQSAERHNTRWVRVDSLDRVIIFKRIQ